MKKSLTNVTLPNWGYADSLPPLSADIYRARVQRVVQQMSREKLDFLVIYADREHFANLAFLTGFEPRFEEALYVLDAHGQQRLLVGNECMSYLPDAKLGIEIELFQDFSLLGQPRESSRPLQKILQSCGIAQGKRIGCVGWKYFAHSQQACEIPSYIVDLLRQLSGDAQRVINANAIFMNPQDGLRILNEPAQIVQFEYASSLVSRGVRKMLQHFREGISEQELEHHYDSQGLALSCHRMLSFGAKAQHGLASPSANRAQLGDPYTTAFGLVGGLTARAGYVARGPQDLPIATRDFYPRFVQNYFEVIATWYEQVRVGANASDVFAAVDQQRDDKLFKFALNPGHYLHLDEWVHSPFSSTSSVVLRSGMVLQMDIIPVSQGPFCCSNAEDGIVLADADLQAELKRLDPRCFERMIARRQFVREVIGIQLDDSMLPISDTTAWLPPYALNLEKAFAKTKS